MASLQMEETHFNSGQRSMQRQATESSGDRYSTSINEQKNLQCLVDFYSC